MKTIIACTDFSDPANNALEYAIAVARNCKAKLVIYNSFEPPIPTSTASVAIPGVYKLLAQNKKRLEKLSIRISTEYGIMVDYFTNISYVDEELEKQVKRLNADLVVMGMCGSSLDRKMFGSITTAVIRSAKFPVLVVPEGAPFMGIDNILCACEYEFVPEPAQLEVLRDLAFKFKSNVQFLHIDTKENSYEVPGEFRDTESKSLYLEEAMSGIIHSYREMKDPSVTEGIKRGIREFQADLLVMIPHKTGFLDFVFNRSITRKMAFSTRIPLLSIPFHGVAKRNSGSISTVTSEDEKETAAGLSGVD